MIRQAVQINRRVDHCGHSDTRKQYDVLPVLSTALDFAERVKKSSDSDSDLPIGGAPSIASNTSLVYAPSIARSLRKFCVPLRFDIYLLYMYPFDPDLNKGTKKLHLYDYIYIHIQWNNTAVVDGRSSLSSRGSMLQPYPTSSKFWPRAKQGDIHYPRDSLSRIRGPIAYSTKLCKI